MNNKQRQNGAQNESAPPRTSVYASISDWWAEARRRFGDDPMGWTFICPACGFIASTQDWKDAGASVGEVAFSCVGRHTKEPREAFQKGKGPCDYTGGGLIRLNPVCVKDGDKEHFRFDFAPE